MTPKCVECDQPVCPQSSDLCAAHWEEFRVEYNQHLQDEIDDGEIDRMRDEEDEMYAARQGDW